MGIGFLNKVQFQTLSTFDAASLTSTYQAINSSGFEKAVLILRLVNASTADVLISYDGTNDHDVTPGTAANIPRNFIQLDFTSAPNNTGYIYIPARTKVYVKGTAGVGTIYLAAYSQGVR